MPGVLRWCWWCSLRGAGGRPARGSDGGVGCCGVVVRGTCSLVRVLRLVGPVGVAGCAGLLFVVASVGRGRVWCWWLTWGLPGGVPSGLPVPPGVPVPLGSAGSLRSSIGPPRSAADGSAAPRWLPEVPPAFGSACLLCSPPEVLSSCLRVSAAPNCTSVAGLVAHRSGRLPVWLSVGVARWWPVGGLPDGYPDHRTGCLLVARTVVRRPRGSLSPTTTPWLQSGAAGAAAAGHHW